VSEAENTDNDTVLAFAAWRVDISCTDAVRSKDLLQNTNSLPKVAINYRGGPKQKDKRFLIQVYRTITV